MNDATIRHWRQYRLDFGPTDALTIIDRPFGQEAVLPEG
jgi:hypothetical protein